MEYKLYVLLDPRESVFNPRYVGITSIKLNARLRGHIADSKKYTHHNARWITSLLNDGTRPEIRLIDIADSWSELCEMEIGLICKYRQKYNITNCSDGGDGNYGYKPSLETLEKLRSSHLGYSPTDDARRNMSEAQRNRPPMSDKCRLKIGASKVGNKYWLGRKHTPETMKKLFDAKRNISPETIEKMRMNYHRFPNATCPHCGMTGQVGLMKRWHFDNCKSIKNTENV